jgi:hypothetical protein
VKRQVDAAILQNVDKTPMSRDELSPTNWKMGVRLFGREGKHCDTVNLIARGRTLPPDFVKQCEKSRDEFLRDQRAWWLKHYGPNDPRSP